MEVLKYDVPTLHRPVSPEQDFPQTYTASFGRRKLRPIPTPPHKDVTETSQHFPDNRPSTSSGFSFPSIPNENDWRICRAKQSYEAVPEPTEFEESYTELAAQKAYRHPNPGGPHSREGALGGTWRHMKEAIGYGPGRLMWIDGVVSLYDFTLNNERPWSGCPGYYHCTKEQSSQRGGEFRLNDEQQCAYRQPETHDNDWYAKNRPKPLLFSRIAPNRQAFGDTRSKGNYSMSQIYK